MKLDPACGSCSLLLKAEKALGRENDYNLSVSTYVEVEDIREKIDIVKLNAEIKEIVAREEVLRKAIDDIIAEERLKEAETRRFIENAFKYGEIKTTGTDIDKCMPPASRFGGNRAIKKQDVIEKLKVFFQKYYGVSGSFSEDEVKTAKYTYDIYENPLHKVAYTAKGYGEKEE